MISIRNFSWPEAKRCPASESFLTVDNFGSEGQTGLEELPFAPDRRDHFHLDFGYALATAGGDVGRIPGVRGLGC